MIVGYIRMCTQAEDRDREKALHQWGAEKLYWEKDSSRSWVRPAYEEMAATLQPGDTVVVSEFRQLAGSARDVLILLHRLYSAKVEFASLREGVLSRYPLIREVTFAGKPFVPPKAHRRMHGSHRAALAR